MMSRTLYLLFIFFCFCTMPQHLKATATIVGTVTDSLAANPIQNALIEAVRGGKVRYSDTTGADGTYSLSGIEPSNYTLVVSASNFQTQTVGVKPKNNQTTTVDFQIIPIGGTIEGIVIDEITTLPISGSTVRIFQGTNLIQQTQTNPSGFFSVPNLAPENYVVLASAPGYNTQFKGASVEQGRVTSVDFALEKIPGAIAGTVIDSLTMLPIAGALIEVFEDSIFINSADTDGSGSYFIPELAQGSYTIIASAPGFQSIAVGAIVESGITTVINFALERASGTIAGTVTSASDGNAIRGATIQVWQNNILFASVLTDPNGQYEIPGFPPGSYVVIANANGFQIQAKGAVVESNIITTVNFSLVFPPGSIAGQVIDAVSSKPISGAIITVVDEQIILTTAVSDINGNYEIRHLHSGNFNVIASKGNFQTQIVGAEVISNQTTIVNFALIPNPGTILGKIIDSLSLNPIAGARVSIFRGGIFIASGISDNNGNYMIGNLAPGEYTLVATSGRNFQASSRGAFVISNITTIVNFALDPQPGDIAGIVRNAQDGAPISGAHIFVFSNFVLIESVLTDDSGHYTVSGLAPGNYLVLASASNFSISHTGASVSANQTTIVNFALSSNPGSLSGSVKDASTQNPVPGAIVTVKLDIVTIAQAVTDMNGNYTIFNLSPDTYEVTVSALGFQSQTQIAEVISNQTTNVFFLLAPNPGAISGTISSSVTSNPIPNATVAVFQGTIFIDFALTDDAGKYTIQGLAPGEYTVLVIAKGFQSAFSKSTVASDSTTIVNFILNSNPRIIQGKVTEACKEKPVPGAIILVTVDSTIVGFDLTDNSGNYAIDVFAPGTYTVTAIKKNFQRASSQTVVLNSTSIVNFTLIPIPLPPKRIFGRVLKNQFATQTDIIHAISWKASPSPCVTRYLIFRNGKLIAYVSSSSKLQFLDHNRRKKSDIYAIKAENSFGLVSDPVTIKFRHSSRKH